MKPTRKARLRPWRIQTAPIKIMPMPIRLLTTRITILNGPHIVPPSNHANRRLKRHRSGRKTIRLWRIGIVGDRVALAQIFKKRRQGREFRAAALEPRSTMFPPRSFGLVEIERLGDDKRQPYGRR